jgi:hypothetical protein
MIRPTIEAANFSAQVDSERTCGKKLQQSRGRSYVGPIGFIVTSAIQRVTEFSFLLLVCRHGIPCDFMTKAFIIALQDSDVFG